MFLSKQYQDEIIVNIRTKVGRLEEDLSIQERKNYRNYALDGCHCLFFFSSLLEFLDTFFFSSAFTCNVGVSYVGSTANIFISDGLEEAPYGWIWRLVY